MKHYSWSITKLGKAKREQTHIPHCCYCFQPVGFQAGGKCMLMQKWFPSGLEAYGLEGIPSDPELENQINDRISFKKFLGLPLDKPSSLRLVGASLRLGEGL